MSLIPPALAKALEARRLTVLCGAGISMAPPSYLPSWWGFNNTLLEEIKAKASPRIPESVRPAFNRLRLETMRVEAFSDKVVRTFAGDSYFPILEVLESERPNANHAALAELGRRGVLRALLTSNFDTLIERAFREAAVPLQVLAGSRDAVEVQPLPGVCTLLKVHGSVTATSTLVDTVSQKLRGLAPVVRARIGDLLRDNHLLVLGFSGADLSFGEDYLALSRALEEGAEITWLYRPGSSLGPEAQRTVARAGERGALVEGQLPEFFSLLGVKVASAALGGDPSSDRKRAEEAVCLRIRSWLESPHIGDTTAAALCATLLEDRGEREAARAVLSALSKGAEVQEAPFPDGIVLRRRTVQALRDRNPDEAREWVRRERAYWRELEGLSGKEISPEARREMLSGLASAAINEAAANRMAGDLEGARRELAVARGLAVEAEALGLLAQIAVNEAEIANLSGEGSERVLAFARRASSRARCDGDVRSLRQGKALEARALTDLAEYDRALEALEEARQLADLEDAAMPRLELRRLTADIELRRGRIEEAYSERLAVIQEAKALGETSLAAGLLYHLCIDFAFHPPLRDQVLTHLDSLLAATDERSASAEAVRTLGSSLRDGHFPSGPIPDLQQGKTREERQRIAVARAEFASRRTDLPSLFLPLCQGAYGQPDRLFDLAVGYQKAAERAGDREAGAEALNFLGVAQDLQGDFMVAAETFERALAAVPVWATSLRARVWVHLALARSRSGASEGIEDLLENAERHFLETQDFDNAIRARMHMAEHRARRGDVDRAISHGERALERSRNFGTPAAQIMLEMYLRDWRQRQEGAPDEGASELLRGFMLSGHPEEIALSGQDLDEMRTWATGPQQIANLGLAALQGGRTAQARELFQQALQIYREQEDLLGISRCLNNLADVAESEENLDEAIELTTRALDLRRALGDEEGEVRTLAGLAMRQFHVGRHTEALRSARLAVELSEASAPSRDRLAALIAFTLATRTMNRLDEAIPAARRALDLFAVVRAPGLEPIQPLLREIAEEVPRAALPLPPGSEREELMRETERLQRSGRFADSLNLILKLLEREDVLPEERARLWGTRGNALQSAERNEEAVSAYEKAAVLLRETRQEVRARQADNLRAVSLRRLGRAAESEGLLREALSRSSTGRERASIVTSLANIPLEMDELGEARIERLGEALRLVTEALEDPLVGNELRGLLEIQRGRIAAEIGDEKEKRAALEQARRHLLRSNSRHLEVPRMLLNEAVGFPGEEEP